MHRHNFVPHLGITDCSMKTISSLSKSERVVNRPFRELFHREAFLHWVMHVRN